MLNGVLWKSLVNANNHEYEKSLWYEQNYIYGDQMCS